MADTRPFPGGRPPNRGRRPGGPAIPGRHARVPNAILGTLLFLGAEAMFFASLISAFLVLRAGVAAWPPPDQPRLPVGVSALNTVVLLASGVTMVLALRAIRADRRLDCARWLRATTILGIVFLLVQGSEWVRLLGHGLSASSSLYGAFFYTLIGCHGAHVLGGVVALAAVWRASTRGRWDAARSAPVVAAGLYWFFVVGVWPLLYVLVYLG